MRYIPYHYYRIFSLIFILLRPGIVPAPPADFPVSERDRVLKWQKVLQQSAYYSLFMIDPFEGETRWKIHRSTANLRRLTLSSKTPAQEEGFVEEAKVYRDFTPYYLQNLQSLFLHSYFETPSRESIFLKPIQPIFFSGGLPVRFFYWIYSNGYDLSFRAHLSQKKGGRLIVDLGKLNHYGWKRFEVTIPLNMLHRELYEKRRSHMQLRGFSLKPGARMKKGDFFIYIDQLSALIEKKMSYPGSEIQDTWR